MNAPLASTGVNANEFPRTLFMLDNLSISGAEMVAVNLLRHAQARGLPVAGIVCMDDLVGAEKTGAPLRAFAGPTGGTFFRRLLRGLSRVPAFARAAEGFDIIVPVTTPVIPWALAAGMASGAKVVPWIHYDLDGFAFDRFNSRQRVRDLLMNALYTRVAPAFDRLLFVSSRALESFARARGGAKRGWVAVPNVYDREPLTNALSEVGAALERCRAAGKAALLFAGRITRQKRWEEAVKVAELLAAKGFPFELHIAGDGPEMEQLRSAVSASTARDHVFLHGFDLDLMATLARADALLLTSLYEAWPTVILEAFNLGVPVLSYDCPSGPAELLGRNLERGALCDGAEEMAAKIEWLLDPRQASVRQRMAAEGQTFLEAHLPDNALAQWSAALRGMMPNGRERHQNE